MPVVLRPYQEAAVDRVVASIDNCPILVGPTGSGKTVMLVAAATRISPRILWLAHRRELIKQAASAFEAQGHECGIILAGEPRDESALIQVGSIQTVTARGVPPGPDLLVLDECHHASSKSYRDVIASFRRRIGGTATPFRLDGKGLGSAGFGDIVIAAYTDELCEEGVLHAPRVFVGKRTPNLTGIKKTAGDYNLGQLASAMTQNVALLGDIIENWKRHAEGKRTVAFSVDIAHGQQIVDRFTEAGVAAELLTGGTPRVQREATLARLAAGATTVVVNCMVLTEGWDLPALECAVVARPTASLNLHLQMIGRIMRSCDGKDGAIVLDHAGNYHRHGLVTERIEYSLEGRPKKSGVGGPGPQKTCSECGAVVPAGCHKCEECGHEFPVEDKTTEDKTAEMVEVGKASPKPEPPFQEKLAYWWKCLKTMERQAHQRLGVLFGEIDEADYVPRACGMYKSHFKDWPINVGTRLIDVDAATPRDWEELRAHFRAIAVRKQMKPNVAIWFVNTKIREIQSKRGKAAS